MIDREPTIEQQLNAHGFCLQDTGGNCTAYVRYSGDVREYITIVGDPTAPDALEDVCAVCSLDVDEDGCESNADEVVGYTLNSILIALAKESEYFLLTLRLVNDTTLRPVTA